MAKLFPEVAAILADSERQTLSRSGGDPGRLGTSSLARECHILLSPICGSAARPTRSCSYGATPGHGKRPRAHLLAAKKGNLPQRPRQRLAPAHGPPRIRRLFVPCSMDHLNSQPPLPSHGPRLHGTHALPSLLGATRPVPVTPSLRALPPSSPWASTPFTVATAL